MGSVALKQVDSLKYLGVTIDDKLDWKRHIDALCKNVSKCCNIMYKVRHLIPIESRLSIYYSLFYSKVTYGIMCWGNTYDSVLNPLRIYQNKCVKAMLFMPTSVRTKTLLFYNNLLNINDIMSYEVAKHVHKFHSNTLPTVFSSQFSLLSARHPYSTRASTRRDLVVPRSNKDIGKRSIKIFGARIWNKVPNHLRTMGIQTFAKAYKSLLIEQYYCEP